MSKKIEDEDKFSIEQSDRQDADIENRRGDITGENPVTDQCHRFQNENNEETDEDCYGNVRHFDMSLCNDETVLKTQQVGYQTNDIINDNDWKSMDQQGLYTEQTEFNKMKSEDDSIECDDEFEKQNYKTSSAIGIIPLWWPQKHLLPGTEEQKALYKSLFGSNSTSLVIFCCVLFLLKTLFIATNFAYVTKKRGYFNKIRVKNVMSKYFSSQENNRVAVDLLKWLNIAKGATPGVPQPPYMSIIIVYPLGTNLRSFISATGISVRTIMGGRFYRLSTFSNYPSESPISAIRLSDAGFYYECGEGDEVTCFECGVKHKGWKTGDIPVLIHKSISPSCDFIRNKSPPTGNEFGSTSQDEQQHSGNSALQLSFHATAAERLRISVPSHNGNGTNKIQAEHSPDSRSHAVTTYEVKYPNYTLYDNRLDTYKGFPVDLNQKPKKLAKAGFFYEGASDRVRCFCCGKSVSDWKIKGKPWTEHAQRSKKCNYIRQYKGDNFIQTALLEHNDSTMDNSKETDTAVGGGSRPLVSKTSNGVSEESKLTKDLVACNATSQFTQRDAGVFRNPRDTLEMTKQISKQSAMSDKSKKIKTVKSKSKTKAIVISESSLTKNSNFVTQQANVTAEGATSTHGSPSSGMSNAQRNIPSVEALKNMTDLRTCADVAEQRSDTVSKPRFPKLAAYTKRRHTYKDLKDMNQKPDELATAGFFYTGEQDNMRCFHCGGEVKEWQPEDEPWAEHAKWFPKCIYLQQSKGQKYIKLVHSELLRKQARRRAMELAVINTVIDMGFPEDSVNQAFRKCATEQGDSNVKADVLLQELWRQEERNHTNVSNEDDEGSNKTPLS